MKCSFFFFTGVGEKWSFWPFWSNLGILIIFDQKFGQKMSFLTFCKCPIPFFTGVGENGSFWIILVKKGHF